MVDVSVVIPTHNRRLLLNAALRSVQGQRHVDVEVLVVDDGSTDDTGQIVAELHDDRFRLIRYERPQGVAAARNAGAVAARGRWIALLDDDDLWGPEKLARQLAAAEGRSTAWVYAGVVEVAADGRVLAGARPPRPAELVAGLPRRNVLPAGSSNVLVRTDELRAVGGFDPALRHLADWDLWLRLARLSQPAVVDAPLVAYRQHTGQATLDTTGMVAEAKVLAARHHADPVSIYRWAAWSSLRAGRRRAAVASYARAVAAGDLSSIFRAAVAIGLPRPTRVRSLTLARPDLAWQQEAQNWLNELAAPAAPLPKWAPDRPEEPS